MADSTHSTRSTNDNSDLDGPDNSSNYANVLSRINESYHESKARQIVRLLHDQEELNQVFRHRTTSQTGRGKLSDDDKDDDSDDSLSEASLQETEKRLSVRLSLHKQKGGRSRTSMGFNHGGEEVSSDDDNDKTDEMAEQERQINTRINRPKSSYVRRTTMCQSYGDNDDEIRTQPRPMSRCGVRSGDSRSRRMVLKETSYNCQQETPIREFVDDSELDKDLVDGSRGYEKYANTRYAAAGTPTTGLVRQRSRIRGFCSSNKPTDMTVSSSSTDISNCQMQEQTTVVAMNPEEVTRESSPTQKHRRQQIKSARANRSSSENVFLVRQRTESRLIRGPTANPVRPKSDKMLVNASGNTKALLSIDAIPNQGAASSKIYPTQQNPINTLTQQYPRENYERALQQRPTSRRSSFRTEGSGPVRNTSKNMSVYGGRGQAIGLMKLPPLDPSIGQRTERALVIPTGETCA